MKVKTFKFCIVVLPFAFLVLSFFAGCSPTYPKERFKESIIKLCKDEYKADVKVETFGKTIAIYLPLMDLLDFTFAITKSASEKINDVILSVSRVALSTDAKFDFYCVIAHDVRLPEIQIVIIKSVKDVKRFLLNDISRGEYSKRMLIDIRLSPQAQKERTIKEIFEKMGIETKWQEQVMNDFFRSEPTALGDIGYWNDKFYVKDISLPEFLAEQIASRVKNEFRDEKDLSDAFVVKTAKGGHVTREGKKYFKLEVSISPKWVKEIDEQKLSGTIFRRVLKIAHSVVRGYKFEDFDYVEIWNVSDGRLVKVSRNDLETFKEKNAKIEDMMPMDTY